MIHQIKSEEMSIFLQSSILSPGDTLLLETGAVYESIYLKNLTDVLITAEGEGAVIQGGSEHGIVAENCQNLLIENIKARGIDRKYHNKQGVGFLFRGGGEITAKHCEAFGFQRSGFEACGVRQLHFEDLSAHDNGYSGIHVTRGDDGSWSQDVVMTRCSAVNNPGDPKVTSNHSGNGIVLYYTKDALVEYCDASYNGWDMDNSAFNGPVGIWCANCLRAVFRYCLSHDNRTQWGKTDGGGFDFDGGTKDSLMEYCYSYNNSGSGYMFCQYANAAELSGNTIRYCASFNDGTAYHKSALYLFDCGSASMAAGGQFYRNLLYNSAGRDIVRGHIDDTFIHDNIMLLKGDGKFFNHEFDDSGLLHRGPERQVWGKVTFEDNCLVKLEDGNQADEITKLADYRHILNATELPDYFSGLSMETRSIL